jgi:hypothetical protein
MRVAIVAVLLLAGCAKMQVERDVAAVLKDPASAQFGKITIRNEVACGEVNSKNGFGAYTGMTPFMVKGGLLYIAQSAGQEVGLCCSMHQLDEVRETMRSTFDQCNASLPEPIPLG